MYKRNIHPLFFLIISLLITTPSWGDFELPTNLFLNDLAWSQSTPQGRPKVGIRCPALREFDKYSLLYHENSQKLSPYVRLNDRGSCRLDFEGFEELVSDNQDLAFQLDTLLEAIPMQVEKTLEGINPWIVRSTQVRILVRPKKDRKLWGISGLIQGLTLQWPNEWDLSLHIQVRFYKDGEKPLSRVVEFEEL